VQESVVGTVAKSGQTPTDSALGSPDTQLLDAILAFAGANSEVISSTPGSALPALSAGLVVVNATAGNISITLPPSAGLGGQVQSWRFVRTDTTTNTVSIAFHAGDTTLVGGAAGPLSLGALAEIDLWGDGATHWMQSNQGGVQIFGTAGAFTFTVPRPVLDVEVQGGGGSAGCSASVFGGCGAAGGFSRKRITGLTVGSSITVTVGDGGAGGAAGFGSAGNGGSTGSTSSFWVVLQRNGRRGRRGYGFRMGGRRRRPRLWGDENFFGGNGSDGNPNANSPGQGLGGASFYGGGGRNSDGGSGSGLAAGSGAGAPYGSSPVAGAHGSPGQVSVRW
jgi:hypothetical protein